jgi:hypothetical protein
MNYKRDVVGAVPYNLKTGGIRLNTADILCVFQGIQNAALGQKIRRDAANIFESEPKKKGAGRITFAPH